MGTIRKLLSRLIGSQTMAGTIILGFLLIFLPLSIAVGVYTIGKVTDSLEETTQRNLTTLAEQVSEELDRALFGAFQDIQTLATNPVISSSEASDEDKLAEMKKSQDFYDQLSEYYSVFLNVTLIDLEGQEIISTDESVEPQENWADRKVFSQAREGAKNKTWVSPPYPYYSSDESSEVVMAYASPVVDNSGNTIAVIIGRMDMVTIWEITDGTTIGEEGFTRIIDGAGNIYAHPDKEKLFSKFEYFDVAASMDQYVTYDESGEKIVAAYAALEGPQWYVIVSQPQNEAFALVEDNIKEAIWVAGALFLLFIVIIIVLISRLTRPIHTLSVGAEAIGSGNLAHRVPISGSVETRRLATSFNEMSGNLQKAERLRAEHVLLRKLQAASLALASALSPDEVLRIISNGVRDILSCDIVWVLLADEDMNYLQTKRFTLPERDQMVDEHISLDSMSQKKIDLAGDLGLVARVFNGGNPLFIDDLSDRDDLAESDSMINALIAQLAMNGLSLVPLRLPDRSLGIMIFGRSSDDTLSDEEKRVILVFAHQATISLERARLHDQDMQSTAELVRLNDLKSRLLHVLSHELKTPLTSLKTSTRLLQETDLAEMDKRTQQRLMGSIARATDRLIDVADDIYPIAGVM
ncbi:MAG: HAMP domain-containing protein, partial [Chloroflexi bacterium]|nr:HAMP domain-containing protein [Chloroflexota bacterium]